MHSAGRLFLTGISFAITYWLVTALAFPLFAHGTPRTFRMAAGLACGLLAGIPAWRATAVPTPGLGTAMLKRAGLFGLVGFLGGFVGPMILAPDANQGPMLGIFITGPGGVVLGTIAGAMSWRRARGIGPTP